MMEKLQEILAKKDTLSLKELKNLGITVDQIIYLTNNGFLEKTDKKHYKVIKEFVNFWIDLFDDMGYETATNSLIDKEITIKNRKYWLGDKNYLKYNVFNNLIVLAKKHDYEGMINVLEYKMVKTKLTEAEYCCLYLCLVLINIKMGEDIPQINIIDDKRIFNIILNNDFQLALKLEEQYMSSSKLNKDKGIIYILLKEINKEIELRNNNQTLKRNLKQEN